VQPSDVFAADVLAAVARPLLGHQARLDARGLDHHLLLAAPFQRDEPERGRLDAVPAGREQAVVLVDRGLDAAKRVGHLVARLDLHRDLPGLVADDDVIFVEGRGILADGFQRAAQRRERRAVDGVRMAHGDDVRMRLVDRRVQHEAGAVHGMAPFHHAPFVVGQYQVRYLDLRKVDGHGVGPVHAGVFRIAHRQVSGEPVVEALQRECAAGRRQAFLQMPPMLRVGREHRQFGIDQPFLLRLIDGDPAIEIDGGTRFFQYGRHGCSFLLFGVETMFGAAQSFDKRWLFMER
jgi:hypothetical protein